MINLPVRPLKPRNVGITMVIDKGLSLAESESLVEKAGDYIDMVKIGFGSSLITKNLAEKIKIFKEKKIKVIPRLPRLTVCFPSLPQGPWGPGVVLRAPPRP